MHALRSFVDSVQSLFAQLAERLQQQSGSTEVPQLMQILKNELRLKEGKSEGGTVLDALQSWSLERQTAILQMKKDIKSGIEEESEEAVQVLDIEATLSACIGSTQEVLEQIRAASLLKHRLSRK